MQSVRNYKPHAYILDDVDLLLILHKKALIPTSSKTKLEEEYNLRFIPEDEYNNSNNQHQVMHHGKNQPQLVPLRSNYRTDLGHVSASSSEDNEYDDPTGDNQ
jgi:hypothetical protein